MGRGLFLIVIKQILKLQKISHGNDHVYSRMSKINIDFIVIFCKRSETYLSTFSLKS